MSYKSNWYFYIIIVIMTLFCLSSFAEDVHNEDFFPNVWKKRNFECLKSEYSQCNIDYEELWTDLTYSNNKKTDFVSFFDFAITADDVSNESTQLDNLCFKDAVFLGNSRTQGLMLYSSANDLKVYAGTGINLITFFTAKTISNNGQMLTNSEMLSQNSDFNKVFINFGINELGWETTELFIDKYIELINFVKLVNPQAKIYIQSIIPVEKYISNNDRFINNQNIAVLNKAIKEMCDTNDLIHIDVNRFFSDSDGHLPKKYSYDGIHLNNKGYEKWLVYLKMCIENSV